MLLDPDEAPSYQQIAAKAEHLRDLGMNLTSVGYALGVSRFVVRKALRWVAGLGRIPSPLSVVAVAASQAPELDSRQEARHGDNT